MIKDAVGKVRKQFIGGDELSRRWKRDLSEQEDSIEYGQQRTAPIISLCNDWNLTQNINLKYKRITCYAYSHYGG